MNDTPKALGAFARKLRSAPEVLRFRLRRYVLARRYLRGRGLEVGALHAPLTVPRGTRVEYVDRMTVADLRVHYPELAGERLVEVDVVDDGETLVSQADGSADFIIANHFIEHTEDPLGTFANHLRVLRPGGVLYMAVPNRRKTFDRDREGTSLEHLVEDHEQGPSRSRSQHLEEWARLVEHLPVDELPARVQALDQQGYSIHFHTWQAGEFRELLDYASGEGGLPFSVAEMKDNEHEFIVILRRT